jgi:hypothetical protein
MKWIRSLIALVALGISGLTVAAQLAPWTALLYQQEDGRVIEVDQTGVVRADFDLPTIMGFREYGYSAATSSDGRFIAYSTRNPEASLHRFQVYDRVLNRVAVAMDVPDLMADSLDFAGVGRMFSSDGATVAYGYSSTSLMDWTLVLLDTGSGSVVATLRSSDPQAVAMGIAPFMTPVVQLVRGDRVTFNLVNAGSEGGLSSQAWSWQPGTGLVTAETGFSTISNDLYWPTMEIIAAVQDERFPNMLPSLPLPIQRNTLQVHQFASGISATILADANVDFGNPTFIQDGERVLFYRYDYQTEDGGWQIIARDGRVVASELALPITNPRDVLGTQDGFLLIDDLGGAGTSNLRFVDTRLRPDNAGIVVWTGASPSAWRLLWATPPRGISVASFPEWPALLAGDGPIDAASIGATPAPVGVLSIGGRAQINTTEGDQLNVRRGPGTSHAIIGQAAHQSRVTLLQGPLAGDGYNWWNIQLGDGTIGWVVEAADGVQTLLPIR